MHYYGVILLFLGLLVGHAAAATVELSNIVDYSVDAVFDTTEDWARYDHLICEKGTKLTLSQYSFIPLNFTSPFFSEKEVNWYLSYYGFLSPSRYPMCPFFCADSDVTKLYGNYAFTESSGGDWPMAALFAAPLRPNSQSSICVFKEPTSSYITVEFRNVPTQNGELLTAQAVLDTDGTIVFRYKNAPKSSASTGLIFSKRQRKVLTKPSITNSIVGYRFTPKTHLCTATSESACIDPRCSWCGTLDLCLPSDSPLCPSSSYMYDVKVTQTDFDWSSDDSVPMKVLRLGTSYELDDSVRFFGKTYDNISFTQPGAVSFVQTNLDCNPIWGACPNGNYSFSILPLQASLATLSTVRRVTPGPKLRTILCPSGCSDIQLFYVPSVGPRSYGTMESRYRYDYYLSLNSKTGEIKILYGNINQPGVLYTNPALVVGLINQGLEDAASVVVPAELIRRNVLLTFTYKGECPDCGVNGLCESGSCVCKDHFQGTRCEECEAGYYGPTCTACECQNGASCLDGINATGGCQCDASHVGRHCELSCDPGACVSCDPRTGYSNGTYCVCFDGWTGDTCSERQDRCKKYTIESCSSCVTEGCGFCFDLMCFSPSLSGTDVGYTCSQSVTSSSRSQCTVFPIDKYSTPNYEVVVLVFLCIIVVILFIAMVLVWCLVIDRKAVVDRHTAQATGGAPDFRMTRRDREIVHNYLLPREHIPNDQLVLGIPLRQIQLETLYRRQNRVNEHEKQQ